VLHLSSRTGTCCPAQRQGSVLVGKIFTAIDNDTGQVLDQTVTGRGIDQARLITCVFLFPDTTIPGLGTIDLRFEVQALPTPQGG
jgi:hypothetical protein